MPLLQVGQANLSLSLPDGRNDYNNAFKELQLTKPWPAAENAVVINHGAGSSRQVA